MAEELKAKNETGEQLDEEAIKKEAFSDALASVATIRFMEQYLGKKGEEGKMTTGQVQDEIREVEKNLALKLGTRLITLVTEMPSIEQFFPKD